MKEVSRRVGFHDVYSKSKNVVTKKKQLAKGEGLIIETSEQGNTIYVPSMGKIFIGQATGNEGQLCPEIPRKNSSDTVRAHGDLYPPSYKSVHLQQHAHTDRKENRSDMTSRATISGLNASSTDVLLSSVNEGPD